MKKLFLAIMCLAVLASAGCSSKKSTASVLKGHIDSVKNGALIACVSKLDFSGTDFIDTIRLDENGNFTYTLNDGNFRDVVITGMPSEGKKLFEEKFGYFQVAMLPGETLTVTGTLKEPKLSGGKYYEDKEKAEAILEPMVKEFEALYENFAEKIQAGGNRDSLNKEYLKCYEQFTKDYKNASFEFVKENPDSDYSYYIAARFEEPLRSEAIALLTERVKNGPVKSYDEGLSASMKKREERQKAIEEARKNVAEGKPAPDFTLNDLEGKPLSLSSLKGKYVVLDFWGSWCGWCIKGIPHMKEYYKKYNGKLEILGIACGDTEKEWKDAVKEHSIPWLNVINDEEGGKDVSSAYAVTGYPTKVVVDPQGNIAKIIVGESPEFYEYLDKILK